MRITLTGIVDASTVLPEIWAEFRKYFMAVMSQMDSYPVFWWDGKRLTSITGIDGAAGIAMDALTNFRGPLVPQNGGGK